MEKSKKKANRPIIETKSEALAAVGQQAKNLEFCSEEMKGDYDVVYKAITAWPGSIRFASPEMRADSNIALATIQRDANMLRYIRIEDMDSQEARNIVETAVKKKPDTIIFAGELGNDPDIAILALKTLPSTNMLDTFNAEMSQNLDFLEGVGEIAKMYRDEELIDYALSRAIREANGDPGHLEDLRYAIGHFEYNGTIGGNSYNFLRQEILGAQDGSHSMVVPFESGEFSYQDDYLWDMKKESVHIAAEQAEHAQDREYYNVFTSIYMDHEHESGSSEIASERTLKELERDHFPGDPEFRKWYFENIAVGGSQQEEKDNAIEEVLQEDIPMEEEVPHGSAPIQDPPPELSVEELEAEYNAAQEAPDWDHEEYEEIRNEDIVEEKPTEKTEETNPGEPVEEDVDKEEPVDNNPIGDKKAKKYAESVNQQNFATPSAATWKANDLDPTEADFAWWDQYRDQDGVIDFDTVPNPADISFAHAKALILLEPEYISKFPEVPYGPTVNDKICYGRNDERLFNAIIQKHYDWAKLYVAKSAEIPLKLEQIAAESDPAKLAALKQELNDIGTKLEAIAKNRPANLERDSLLFRYAGLRLKERKTSEREGGKDSITKKFTTANPETYAYLVSRSRTDPNITIPVIKADPMMLKYADSKTVNNPNIIFDAYDKNPESLRFAGKSFFLSHKGFVADMIKEDPDIVVKFANGRLLDDKEFAMFAVRQNGMSLLHFNSDIQHDSTIVEAALASSQGEALHRARDEFVNNPSWAKKAVGIIPASLKFFKYAIKGMVGVVKYAVTKDPSAIRYASEEVRGNKKMALELVREDGMVLGDLSANRRADYDVVSEATKQNGLALQFAVPELRNDPEIVYTAVSQNGLALQFAGEHAKNTSIVAIAALQQNIDALGFVGKDLQDNKQFVAKATAIINETKGAEFAERGLDFVPYTFDEVKDAIGKGELPEDKSTFMSRMGEGLSEVFTKPAAERFPVVGDILKKAGHKQSAHKSKTMTFDVESAIKRGREEEVKRKEEKTARESREPSGTTKDDQSDKSSKKRDTGIDK